LILSNDLFGGALEEEVDLEACSSGDIAESARAIFVENEDWRLSIGVSEENTHEFLWVGGLDESKWMNTIGLLSTLTIIVRGLLAVSPHGPGTLFKVELTLSLSKTVNSLTWKLKIELNVLFQHEEVSALRAHQSRTVTGTCELERKSVLHTIFETAHIEPHGLRSGFLGNEVLWWRVSLDLVIGKGNVSSLPIGLPDFESDFSNKRVVNTFKN
jgi:hypothetical protein